MRSRRTGAISARVTGASDRHLEGSLVVTHAGTLAGMAERVWIAEELEQMTPAEQDAIFESSLVTDLNSVPAEFLARVRKRTQERIADVESRRR